MPTRGRWSLAGIVLTIGCADTRDGDDGADDEGIASAATADEGEAEDDDAADVDDGVSLRTVFTFTVEEDRAAFTAVDIAWVGTFGPYAMYEITGPSPRLVGPRIRYDRATTWTMLCASHEYFAAEPSSPSSAITLQGGPSGTDALAVQTLAAAPVDGCSDPADVVNERPPSAATPEDAGVERIALAFDPAPPVGAFVLLRQIGIVSTAPGHNDSHVIPSVCCETAPDCTLEP